MNDNTVEAFKAYFGSPEKLAGVFVIVIVSLMAISIFKTVNNGIKESQNDGTDYTPQDLIMHILRLFAVLLTLGIFLGF